MVPLYFTNLGLPSVERSERSLFCAGSESKPSTKRSTSGNPQIYFLRKGGSLKKVLCPRILSILPQDIQASSYIYVSVLLRGTAFPLLAHFLPKNRIIKKFKNKIKMNSLQEVLTQLSDKKRIYGR